MYSPFVNEKTKGADAVEERRPPQQKRSALTETRLLHAALQVLDREGLDHATIPRIAAAAELSPASIYRRFRDKDDLLRLALLRMLQSSNAQSAEKLRAQLVRPTLAETAGALLVALLKQYREHPQLLRALTRMLEAEPDSAFAREAMQRIAANLAHAAAVLLAHRDSIRHPDPERAVRFAVLSATSAIEVAALDEVSLWHAALPLSDKALLAELTRQMVGYLRRKP